MRPYLVFLLLSMMTIPVFSQELNKDQLLQLSFDSLDRIENKLEYGTLYSKKVFDAHILKAKYAKDTGQLAEAYRKRVWGEDFAMAIKYVDSAIAISTGVHEKRFPSKVHYTKGGLLYEADRPDEAVREFVTAYEFAKKASDYERIVDCFNAIAIIKGEYGHQERAISLLRLSLDYLNTYEEKIDNYDLTKLITLDNIARCYLQIKKIDSSRHYAQQGLDLSSQMKDLDTYRSLSALYAQINYYDGNYIKSRDTLLKYVKGTGDLSHADRLFYLGMIEGKIGNSAKKRRYFKRIDSLLNKNGYPLMDNVKEIFQFLLKEAISKDEEPMVKNYADRLVYYDSILTTAEKEIRSILWTEFDLPEQEASKKVLSDEIQKKEGTIRNYILLSVLLIFLLALYFIKYSRTQKKLREIMHQDVEPLKRYPKKDDIAQMDIDPEVVQSTLKALDKWETDLGYLEQKTSQNSLASDLNTNTSYLSKIINTYKGQTFSNYLKDLRVTYAINHLKENPQIIDTHSTIQIAEMFGFSSLDVFARAIKSKIGVTPAVYFRKLKKSNL
ncbi:helix-turn-helix domain-containing protein [Allomuricauda sp. F6463D]|uniref:helix-turn-helix domain-containing protein n=1 Tax=Allomuricauda sp. F6463D TaxID=2926409 RepID=UPI001FF63FE0|nr:helix-turn-helix domain-containing protein [Muricauda sp. F6463D]MCK0160479.1 helix-turn-helix domain-containing protein [Muricauda sp. F6463D]